MGHSPRTPYQGNLLLGGTEANAIIGTEIEYAADYFRWKDKIAAHPTASTMVVTAKEFHDENSGQGAHSSQITFGQLGIGTPTAKHVTIRHPNMTPGLPSEPMETPGDDLLLKGRHSIIFSVCNLYFEAERISAPSSNKKR